MLLRRICYIRLLDARAEPTRCENVSTTLAADRVQCMPAPVLQTLNRTFITNTHMFLPLTSACQSPLLFALPLMITRRHEIMVLVLLIVTKVSRQFLQLRSWHALNSVPREPLIQEMSLNFKKMDNLFSFKILT